MQCLPLTSLHGLTALVLAAILILHTAPTTHAQENIKQLRVRRAARSSQSLGGFTAALRDALWERGFDQWEIEQLVASVAEKLVHGDSSEDKVRGREKRGERFDLI